MDTTDRTTTDIDSLKLYSSAHVEGLPGLPFPHTPRRTAFERRLV